MLLRQTQAPAYWTSAFHVEDPDIDYLFSAFLEKEMPLTTRELALSLIEYRLHREDEQVRRLIERGQLFEPKGHYTLGQELIFPAFDYALGTIIAERPGQNPDFGDFRVIKVEMADHSQREFASDLTIAHRLNLEENDRQALAARTIGAQEVFERDGEAIIDAIEARLVDIPDAVYFAGYWFLRSLLPEVPITDLHLAEAVLELSGEPLPTPELIKDLFLASKNAPAPVLEFALDAALNTDERFDEVGPSGQVLWFLRRLEPPEVVKTPDRLIYNPINYDHNALTDDLRRFEIELDDEYSELPAAPPARQTTLTLIYPHRRVGTLPLGSRVQALFPTATEAMRIRVTLIDETDNEEFIAWVVRDKRYVVGLDQFYRKHKLPIGAYVIIKASDDPAVLTINFGGHKARAEHIPLVTPNENRLTFVSFKRSIGADYDTFMIVGAEDLAGVDAVATAMQRDRRRGLPELMRDLMIELGKLNPSLQNAVHAKTIYSAVNIVRRCPPGPIFAALASRPEFEHTAGPYWRVVT